MASIVLGSTTIVSESDGDISSTFFGLKSMQSFTSSGTYTKPAHINTIRVFITGSGGGGGGGNPNWNNGGGGGAGGTAIKLIDISGLSIGATIAVTIGTGGAAGSTGSEGSSGATSSFGSYCSATGGTGGGGPWAITSNHTLTGKGGTGVDGDINLVGGDGGSGGGGDIKDESASGAVGGASYWGGGGQNGASVSDVNVNNYGGKVGKAFGSGGGGGDDDNGTSYVGGAGKDGFCLVEEYV